MHFYSLVKRPDGSRRSRMTCYARLESPDDQSPGEWNTLLGRVLRRVEVHKDRLVLVPVVGDSANSIEVIRVS